MHNYQKKLENLVVYSPIEQNAFGKGGIYECLHIPKKSLTLDEYQAKALELDKITDKKSVEEVESMVIFFIYGSFGKISPLVLHCMVLTFSIRSWTKDQRAGI